MWYVPLLGEVGSRLAISWIIHSGRKFGSVSQNSDGPNKIKDFQGRCRVRVYLKR